MNNNSKLQAYMAIASFTVGTVIAFICLFLVEPLGEIATSAISITSEFLILSGALLGVKASFDARLQRFESELEKKVNKDETNE